MATKTAKAEKSGVKATKSAATIARLKKAAAKKAAEKKPEGTLADRSYYRTGANSSVVAAKDPETAKKAFAALTPGKGGNAAMKVRTGSVRELFNSFLSKKPITSAAIAEKTGYPAGRISAYFRSLAFVPDGKGGRKSLARLTPEGWVLNS